MPTTHHLRNIRLAIAAAKLASRTLAAAAIVAAVCLVTPAIAAPSLNFLGKTYRLGSYNQKANAMWEFVAKPETVNNWSTLVTVIDRPDAKSMKDLDRLAEGTLSTFKNAGAKILLAKTMKDHTGKAFDYLVAAIDEPGNHRYELNFLKIAMGSKNAYILIYGARIADAVDYKAKAAKYVGSNSRQIGLALDGSPAPPLASWPRKTF
jgi:hypothetical protein